MQQRQLIARVRPLMLAALAAVPPAPASILSAQVADSTRPQLTLQQVQRWASENSPLVAAAHARSRATDARARGATLPPDPTLSFGIMNRSLPRLGPMRPLNMNQLGVSQMIPLGGKLRLAGAVADRDAEGAQASARAVISAARASAASAFFDLYAADGALTAARENLALLRSLAEAARVLYASGRGRQADVLRADLEVGRMTEDVTRMETMRALAIARLGGVLDRRVDAAALPQLPPLPSELPSLDSLLALAGTSRPALHAGTIQVASADASRQRAQRESWPDLEVTVQYGQRPGDMGVGTERMASIMFGAALPLHGRQRQQRMVEEATAMGDMARADLRGMRAETVERVTAARAEAAQALTLLTLYGTSLLPTAQATVESSLSAYRAGSVDIVMLLDSQMAVNRLRQGEVALWAALGKAVSELEQMTGQELISGPTRDDREER